jgi:hypothetical protein
MSMWREITMAVSILGVQQKWPGAEHDVIYFWNGKEPDELPAMHVERTEYEGDGGECIELIGYSGQKLGVYWDSDDEHWYCHV